MHPGTGLSASRDSAALTGASIVNGLAAYLAVVVASRGLSDVGFAAFSVSWSLWALGVAFLVFPIQHWVIWRSTQDGGTGVVRSSLPRILAIMAVLVIVMFAAGNSNRLFPSGEGWAWILALIGASSGVTGLGRGLLAARGRYDAVAWVIGLENVLRLGAITAGVVFFEASAQWSVLGLSVGPLALVPFAAQLRFSPAASPQKVSVLSELGALAGATALAQVMVQFPPAAAEWLSEPPARVAAIFATFSLGRAPLLVMLAVSARLTAPLARLLSGSATRVRTLLTKLAVVVLLSGFATGCLGYLVGPDIVAWFFGPGRALGSMETAMIATGLLLATASVVVSLALMTKRANRLAAGFWIVAVVVAFLLAILGIGVPAAFFLGEILATALSGTALWYLVSRSHTSSSATP